MSEQLITIIYEKLEKFNDPILITLYNKNNNDLNVVSAKMVMLILPLI